MASPCSSLTVPPHIPFKSSYVTLASSKRGDDGSELDLTITHRPLCCKTSVHTTKKGTKASRRRNAPRTVRCCSGRDQANVPHPGAHRCLVPGTRGWHPWCHVQPQTRRSGSPVGFSQTRLWHLISCSKASAALGDRRWGCLSETSYLMSVISPKAQGIENYN